MVETCIFKGGNLNINPRKKRQLVSIIVNNLFMTSSDLVFLLQYNEIMQEKEYLSLNL